MYYFFLNNRPRGVEMNYLQVLMASVIATKANSTFRVVDARNLSI